MGTYLAKQIKYNCPQTLYNTIPLGIILSLLMPAPNNVHFYDIVTIAKYSSHLGLVVHRLSHVGEKSRIVC